MEYHGGLRRADSLVGKERHFGNAAANGANDKRPRLPRMRYPRGFNRQSRATGNGAKRDSLFLRRHDQSAWQRHEFARSKGKRRRRARFIFSLGGRRNSAEKSGEGSRFFCRGI